MDFSEVDIYQVDFYQVDRALARDRFHQFYLLPKTIVGLFRFATRLSLKRPWGQYPADWQEQEIHGLGALGRRMRFAYPPYKSAPH